MSSSTEPDGQPGPSFRIDELAHAAGTTVRNVRAYQDRGLLPRPRRTGRVAVYSGMHLGRLRLIASLLDRGYSQANIAELLAAWERGQDVAAVLGLEAAMVAPSSGREEATVTAADLVALFGADATDLVDQAVSAGILEPAGPAGFRVADPPMLEVGRLLVGAGVPLGAVLEAARTLRSEAAALARLFVGLVEDHVVEAMADPMPAGRARALSELVSSLRPLAVQVTSAEVGLALEEEIRRRLGDYLARRAGAWAPGTGGRAGGRAEREPAE